MNMGDGVASARQISATHTTLGSRRWHFVLGWWKLWSDADNVTVTPSDLNMLEGQAAVAWPEVHTNAARARPPSLQPFGRHGQDPNLEIRNRDGYGNYTFWRTAPKMCGDRVAILGELGKYVSMSSQRVTGMVETCGTGELVRVDLVGSPGEDVRISFAVFPGSTVVESSCTISAEGHAKLSVRKGGQWRCTR